MTTSAKITDSQRLGRTYRHGPRLRNYTRYALLCQGDETYNENSSLLSFDAILGNGVNQNGFGPGPDDPNRPSEIYSTAFVEETSFAHDGRDATPHPSAVALIEIGPAQESVWPSFTALRRFFHQTLERFHTYLRELIGGLPEEWQPNSALHEWSSQMLSFVATVEAVLIVGSVFISQCIVESAFLHSEEELDQVYRKLLNQQNRTRAMENQVKELELQLQVYERERAFQDLQVREAQGHLSTIDRKCTETERVLNQKRVQELEEARMMQAREELMAYKRKVKKNHQTNSSAEVTLQEEQLSLEVRETRRSRRELAQMKSAMDEVEGLVFDSTAARFPKTRLQCVPAHYTRLREPLSSESTLHTWTTLMAHRLIDVSKFTEHMCTRLFTNKN